MHKKLYMFLCLGISMLCSNCANTPPSSYYILSNSQNSPPLAPTKNLKLGVGPIKLPGRLDRPQIVTQLSTHSIKIHDFHRWGDSLQRQFEEKLADHLSYLLQTPHVILYPWEHSLRPTYQILVQVKKFEGSITTGTSIDVMWQLIEVKHDQLKFTGHFVKNIQSTENTMESYIESQSQALESFSQQVAQDIHRLQTQK
jgi:uncharacterized protein